jgi:phospholipase/carboxylesterase
MAASLAGGLACSFASYGEAEAAASDGRLRSRPGTPKTDPPIGKSNLGLAKSDRDGLFFVPSTYKSAAPAPFALLLHGAGQRANELFAPLSTLAESRGLVLLAVDSREATWDLTYGGFGADVAFIDSALAWAFARVAVDPKRLGVIGFSDGASYALAHGQVNGDLFRRTIAYSPGFLAPVKPTGKSEYFVTHGTADRILSFANTRDAIVPSLKRVGYSVEFRQWDGGHGINKPLMEESVDWFVK